MRRIMDIKLPKAVEYIIDTLEKAGYEGFAVGGCVRDTLLGRDPQDWDITTSAKPETVKKLFHKTIDTGIEHGTVTVMIDHVGYEVTTYRIDGEYEDSRHPKNVEFTTKLNLDLERRDFTINAMAYNHSRGLVDEFEGIQDLDRKIIRCVGDAGERFDEDALRMLRAVRFSGQLGFQIEEATRQAICERAKNLQKISAERIRVELTKLLISKDAGQIREAYHTGILKVILPDIDRMMTIDQKNPHHIYTVGEHSIRSVEVMNALWGRYVSKKNLPDIPDQVYVYAKELTGMLTPKQHSILCITMLFHDIGKPDKMTIDENGIGHFYGHHENGEKMSGTILKKLTFDNETVSAVRHLIRWHDYQYGTTEKSIRKAVAKIGRDYMPMLFLVQFSDILSQNPSTFEGKLNTIYQAIEYWKKIIQSKAALELKDLEISGKDLIRLGVRPGPAIGALLKQLLGEVLDEPAYNRKDRLLERAQTLMHSFNGNEKE